MYLLSNQQVMDLLVLAFRGQHWHSRYMICTKCGKHGEQQQYQYCIRCMFAFEFSDPGEKSDAELIAIMLDLYDHDPDNYDWETGRSKNAPPHTPIESICADIKRKMVGHAARAAATAKRMRDPNSSVFD